MAEKWYLPLQSGMVPLLIVSAVVLIVSETPIPVNEDHWAGLSCVHGEKTENLIRHAIFFCNSADLTPNHGVLGTRVGRLKAKKLFYF